MISKKFNRRTVTAFLLSLVMVMTVFPLTPVSADALPPESPTGFAYNQEAGYFVWNTVPGADNYLVRVNDFFIEGELGWISDSGATTMANIGQVRIPYNWEAATLESRSISVVARNSAGTSPSSDSVTIPAVSTQLTPQNLTINEPNLTWSPVSGINHYRIYVNGIYRGTAAATQSFNLNSLSSPSIQDGDSLRIRAVNPTNFTMSELSEAVVFIPGNTVSVSTNIGSEATVSATWSNQLSPPAPGAVVTLNTTIPQWGGYVFSHWEILQDSAQIVLADRYSRTTTFTMPDGNVSVRAFYELANTVNVTAGSGGTATVGIPPNVAPSGTINVNSGVSVTLVATPSTGNRFVRWESSSEGVTFANAQSASTTFTMPNNNVSVNAVFQSTLSTVTVSRNITGGSTATARAINVAAGELINADQGVLVTLESSPPSGHALSQWRLITGPAGFTITNINNRYSSTASFYMPGGPVAVEAVFAPGNSVTVLSNFTDMGTAVPTSGAAENGTSVSITATPNPGFRFVRWEAVSPTNLTFANPNSASTTFAMRNTAVTVRAIFETGGQLVNVNTNNATMGTADARASGVSAGTSINVLQGSVVTLSATPTAGHAFSQWQVVSGPSGFTNTVFSNRFSPTATFTMPGSAVTVRAVFAVGRSVTVSSNDTAMGTAVPNSGAAQAGTRVTITATPATGHRFVRWEVIYGGAALVNINSASTSFDMPNNAVSIRAIFEYSQTIPTGGGQAIAYTVSSGVTTLDIPSTQVLDIISTSAGGMVSFDLSRLSNVTSVSMPRSAMAQFANANLGVAMILPRGVISLNQAAARSISAQTSAANVTSALTTVSQSSLTAAQRQAINSGDSIFSISFTSGTHTVSQFEGSITLTVPYTGQTPVAAWHLSDNGVRTKLNSGHNSIDRTVTFSTSRLTIHTVGRDGVTSSGENPFTDVRIGDWFFSDVSFAYRNNLMGGTSTTPMTFSPNIPLSRAMIVTILHRREGAPESAQTNNPFSDVPAGQWYSDAVLWAARNNIVSGYADGRFGTNDNITRQDLAVILVRYAAFKSLSLPTVQAYHGFSDESRISGYANDPVRVCFEAGIITGKPGNIFDPLGQSTRAEAAAMLRRFFEA